MKVQISGWVHQEKRFDWDFNKEVPVYNLRPYDKSYEGIHAICAATVEVEIPDNYNHTAAEVAALKEKAKLCKANFAKDMMEIEDSISKLTCIETA